MYILTKYKKIPKNLKATFFFAISSFATSGINYITTPIFTRLLTQEQYGIISVYNSWLQIIQVIASMTLIFPGILNVGLYEHKENRWKYLSNILGITTLSSISLSIVYIIFHNIINKITTLPTSLNILMLVICALQPAITFWTFKKRYEYDYKIAFVLSVGSAIFSQIVSIFTTLYFKKKGFENLAEIRLWSASIITILLALFIYVYICKKGKSIINLKLWKSTVLVAIPLIPHYLGSVILSDTDKIMIGKMIGNNKAGIYGLAAVLSAVGVLLWRALGVTFNPFINEKLGERDFKSIRELIKPLWYVTALICLITSLIAPEFIRIFATKEYLEGIYVIPPISIGIFIHILYDNFSAISFFHKKSIKIMMATVIAALSNLILNWIFIHIFGFIIAGYTTLISYFIMTIIHYFNMCYIEKEKIYDIKTAIIITIILSASCLSCNLLYKFTYIRYILIFIILCILCTQIKPLLKALTKMKI
ncbi:MAG: lipopolysaccharide biosynthesis protein [Candidatus Fimenecus sp.]